MNPFGNKTESVHEKNSEQEQVNIMSTTLSKPEIPKPPTQPISHKVENEEMVATESEITLFNTSIVKSNDVESTEKSDELTSSSSSSSFSPDNLTVTYLYYFSLCF